MRLAIQITRGVYDWFDERYHVTPLIEKNVTKKQVPRTLGWAACFGGLSLLVFLVQVFTGMLLLMYYKPDPNAAGTASPSSSPTCPWAGWCSASTPSAPTS